MREKEPKEKVYKVQLRLGSGIRTLPVKVPGQISKGEVAKVISGFSFNQEFRKEVEKMPVGCTAEAITTMQNSHPSEVVGIRLPENCDKS